MKIGILTFQRAENYGALLQAYALKTYLSSLGHYVSIVDYWPAYHYNHYKLFDFEHFKAIKFRGKISYSINKLCSMYVRFARKHSLTRFMTQYLDLPSSIVYSRDNQVCDTFDIVFYGSDQIWRKQNMAGCDGFNPWYFGDEHIKAKRKIAYAASMGTTSLSAEEKNWVKSYLKNFDYISVREIDLQAIVQSMGYKATLVCDPVFLLSKEDWLSLSSLGKRKNGYILYYNLLNSKESTIIANKLSMEKKLPVKELNMKAILRTKRMIPNASINEFINLIANADYVVTNSFHGLAFSIIMNKQVYAAGLKDKASRIVSLLDICGMSDRLVTADTYNQCKNIDYKHVEERISEFVEETKKFINYALK